MSLIKSGLISTLVMAFIFTSLSMNFSLEVKKLLKKYSLLNSKLVSHSSLAERMKMEKVARPGREVDFNEKLDEKLGALLSGGIIKFKLTHMAKDSILLSVENIMLAQFLDVFFMLSQDENIEISSVDIKAVKDSDYIYCNIFLREKS